MSTQQTPKLGIPLLKSLPEAWFIGLVEQYDCKSPAGIPNQWQRFSSCLKAIPGQLNRDAYGVCYDFDEEGKFSYMSGVQVGATSKCADGLSRLKLPAQKYAVFHHNGHISEIRAVIAAIWAEGLSASGYEPDQKPSLERYGPEFDGRTGAGGYEIWIPVK